MENRELLEYIASLLNIPDTYMWSDEKLTELIKIYKIRGTKECISKTVELYTGEVPIIIEGESPFLFTVKVSNKCMNSYSKIWRIIESIKPAHMEFNLLETENGISLDGNSYLGVANSRL